MSDQGHYRTSSLFYEHNPTNKAGFRPPYTLKEQDHNGFTSLRRLYMECADPGEYEFAKRAFGSYRQWKEITKCNWFQEHLKEWREELAAKLKSEALDVITKRMRHDKTATGFTAAKWIAEGKQLDSTPKRRGRPPKKKQVDDTSAAAAADAKRLGLDVK